MISDQEVSQEPGKPSVTQKLCLLLHGDSLPSHSGSVEGWPFTVSSHGHTQHHLFSNLGFLDSKRISDFCKLWLSTPQCSLRPGSKTLRYSTFKRETENLVQHIQTNVLVNSNVLEVDATSQRLVKPMVAGQVPLFERWHRSPGGPRTPFQIKDTILIQVQGSCF